MANIKDVAKMAGVSVMTVSRVLNNNGPVSEEKRQKVLECVQALNYRPNMIARSLVLNRTSTVGVLLSHIENPAYAQYVASLSETCRAHGMDIILCCAESPETWRSGMLTLLSKQVDGLVILPTEIDADATDIWDTLHDEAVRALHASGRPYVLVGDTLGNDDGPRVQHDYCAGAEMAVDHLIAMGHRRIGSFRFEPGAGLWAERIRGFENAMSRAGLPVRPEWIYSCDFDSIQAAREATFAFLRRTDELPTAICCANDAFAVGAMQALNARGLRVPEDVSLIGHDGNLFCQCTTPFMTTVSIQLMEAGRQSAERLMRLLDEPGCETGRLFIPPRLQEGGTVKRIP